ncbi:TetR/AcrR family transcriptional regulator [Sulfurimonas sp. HSL-1716]|uniref:TetR/AcrR family transcriptional regulator n=1 Tax=Hydrocurvibacter sulfurireducens TaxID=3131937 RepID=UPI0031F9B4DE
MAIIVDKVQKRRDIALTCKDLVVKKGIAHLTISQITAEAGIGKGTFYEYFQNKEDIVFEIVNILLMEHNAILDKKLSKAGSIKEKIKLFFDFFYNEEEAEVRELYKELISISLSEPVKEILEFQTKCHLTYRQWFTNMLDEAVAKGEIVESAKTLANGLLAFGGGMFISSCVTEAIDDLEYEINSYIDTIFELIEVKK